MKMVQFSVNAHRRASSDNLGATRHAKFSRQASTNKHMLQLPPRHSNRRDEEGQQLNLAKAKLLKQFQSLLTLYMGNQSKLLNLVEKQLRKPGAYLHPAELLQLLQGLCSPSPRDAHLYRLDMGHLCEFLARLHTRKKVKYVQIIQESLLSRQSMIQQLATSQEYERVYQSVRPPFAPHSHTIYDQYREIRARFNLPLGGSPCEEAVSDKMGHTERLVYATMRKEAVVRRKQRLTVQAQGSLIQESSWQ